MSNLLECFVQLAYKPVFDYDFDYVSCSKIFLRAGNNPVVLKNSTEHAQTLFIALFDKVSVEFTILMLQ